MRHRAAVVAGLLLAMTGPLAGCGLDAPQGPNVRDTIPETTPTTGPAIEHQASTTTTATPEVTPSTAAGATTTTLADAITPTPGATPTPTATPTTACGSACAPTTTTTVAFKPYVTKWGGQCNNVTNGGFSVSGFATWSDGFSEALNSPGPYSSSVDRVVVGARGSSVSITIDQGTCQVTVTRGTL